MSQRTEGGVVEIGERIVFVRDVKGADAGKHGTVVGVSDDAAVVRCSLNEQRPLVLAQMWDVLPERLWERLTKRRRASETKGR